MHSAKCLVHFALCLLFLSACHNEQTIPPEELARRDSAALHVALMPVQDCFPFYLAERTGIYERLGLEGGALRIRGKIVGFTIGEMCSADTFDVHFEKADGSINGAYPMVCRELTRMLLARRPGLIHINREDDMGLEPLRRSKESYKPEYLLKKYTARWIDDDCP